MLSSSLPNVVHELHDQAILLLKSAQEYVKNEQPQDLIGRNKYECVRIHCESTRVVTRLIHVITWILTYQGIHLKIILQKRMKNIDFPKTDLYLNALAENDPKTPEKIRRLLISSKELYLKVAQFAEMHEKSSTPVLSVTLH